MAVKRIKYLRRFASEPGPYLGADKHHLPQPYLIQKLNKEDIRLQEEILEEYGSWKNEQIYGGSDGTFTYNFNFSAPEIDRSNRREEKREYKEIVEISKAGNFKDLDKLSDLEKFLIKNDFKVLKY